MKRVARSTISDERFDRELATVLDQLAGELTGAPSVGEMQERLAARALVGIRPDRVFAGRRFVLLVALVMLTLAALATMLVAGLSRPTVDPLGNGPIIVAGVAYDPVTGKMGADPCDCTTDATWSADGTRVAFRRSSQILVTDLAQKRVRELGECSGCDESHDHISIASDGSVVAFTDDGDVWLVDVESGMRTRVTELGNDRQARSPTMAPDGERLAFFVEREPGIWVVDVHGGDPWQTHRRRQRHGSRLVAGRCFDRLPGQPPCVGSSRPRRHAVVDGGPRQRRAAATVELAGLLRAGMGRAGVVTGWSGTRPRGDRPGPASAHRAMDAVGRGCRRLDRAYPRGRGTGPCCLAASAAERAAAIGRGRASGCDGTATLSGSDGRAAP